MSAAVSSMLPVALPRFAPSSSNANQGQPDAPAGTAPGWGNLIQDGASSDPLDFDLLAEYLLDDGSSTADSGIGIPSFDFSVESAAGSGVVSPEQTEECGGSVAHVQNLISSHAAANQNRAKGPSVTSPPLAHPGLPMPPVPTPATFLSSAPVTVAPLPSAPAVVVHHQSSAAPHVNAPGSKRRRVDPSMRAATGHAGTVINGHLMPQGIPGRSGRQKTQAQIDRRRERNRILARRTRLRKKFFFESLQKEVIDLQRENTALKEIVRNKLEPEISKVLLDDCRAVEQLPSAIAEACGEGGIEMDKQDFSLIKSIQSSQQCFVITDPSLQDNPIVYASDDFLTLTGYARDDVLGRNCRFLQGTETSPLKVEQVRKAISSGEDVAVTMINYTADGTAFWNNLFIAALRDAQNNIVNFIGVIVKVAAPDAGDPEAAKRLPGESNLHTTEDDVVDGHSAVGNADPTAVAIAAEGTVMAIEGAVSAAVAAAPGVATTQ